MAAKQLEEQGEEGERIQRCRPIPETRARENEVEVEVEVELEVEEPGGLAVAAISDLGRIPGHAPDLC